MQLTEEKIKKLYRIYRSGQNAFFDQQKEEDCSYHSGLELSSWLMGFADAKDDVDMDLNEFDTKITERSTF